MYTRSQSKLVLKFRANMCNAHVYNVEKHIITLLRVCRVKETYIAPWAHVWGQGALGESVGPADGVLVPVRVCMSQDDRTQVCWR